MTKLYTIEFATEYVIGTYQFYASNSQEALADFYIAMGHDVQIESFAVEVL